MLISLGIKPIGILGAIIGSSVAAIGLIAIVIKYFVHKRKVFKNKETEKQTIN